MRRVVWLGSASAALLIVIAVVAIGWRSTAPPSRSAPPPASPAIATAASRRGDPGARTGRARNPAEFRYRTGRPAGPRRDRRPRHARRPGPCARWRHADRRGHRRFARRLGAGAGRPAGTGEPPAKPRGHRPRGRAGPPLGGCRGAVGDALDLRRARPVELSPSCCRAMPTSRRASCSNRPPRLPANRCRLTPRNMARAAN